MVDFDDDPLDLLEDDGDGVNPTLHGQVINSSNFGNLVPTTYSLCHYFCHFI